MTPKQFIRFFDLNPRIMLIQNSRDRYISEMKSFENYSWEEALEASRLIVKGNGDEKPRLYWITAVRRHLELKRHEELKKNSKIAPTVKDALRSLIQ